MPGDAQAGGGRANRKPPRDGVVGKLVDDAELERLPLVLGQSVERLGQRLSRGEALLDGGVPVLGRQVEREAQTLARAGLDPLTSRRLAQQVPGDAEKPGERRVSKLGAEVPPAQPGLGEGLSRQVARGPLDPSPEPPVDLERVSPVQLAERSRIRSRVAHELRVRSLAQLVAHVFQLKDPPVCVSRARRRSPDR